MNDKVALITGGAKGIGRSIGLRLSEQRWSVALCYRKSDAEAEKTKRDIEKSGSKCISVRCDVSDPKAADEFVKRVKGDWGHIDALINCAGPYHRVNLLEETLEGWHSMFDNNLHPIFYLSKAVSQGMIERSWGRIVNFGMANADQMAAQPNLAAHYIAKVGVLILTRSLARTLAPHGITVNCISPGFIDSGSAPKEELEAMVKRIPARF